MSEQHADDDQQPSTEGYQGRSLLAHVQPAPEIPEDLFCLSSPVSRAYRPLNPVSDPNRF